MPSSLSDVTIAFVPRESVSRTIESLNSILRHTPQPYELVVVSACYPETLRAELRRVTAAAGGKLVEIAGFITPNEARNAALAVVETKYVLFVDNDIEVRDDWVTPLLECAQQEDATIVSPLTYELYPPFTRIHLAGGEARLVAKDGGRMLVHEKHAHQHQVESADSGLVKPFRTELVEFHAVMVDADWLRSTGGLDPELCSFSEHWDMSYIAAQQDRKVYVVPASKVNYSPPRTLSKHDLRFFYLRWSHNWYARSIERLAAKYDADRRESYRSWRWVRTHRAHPGTQQLRRAAPWLGFRHAQRISRSWWTPLANLLQSPQRRRDILAWRKWRGEI